MENKNVFNQIFISFVRAWRVSTYMNLPVYVQVGQTELRLMDGIYRERDVELYVEWKGIG